MQDYRFVGNHADEVHIGDTRAMYGFGAFVTLSADDEKLEHNKSLIENGVLVAVKATAKKKGDEE